MLGLHYLGCYCWILRKMGAQGSWVPCHCYNLEHHLVPQLLKNAGSQQFSFYTETRSKGQMTLEHDAAHGPNRMDPILTALCRAAVPPPPACCSHPKHDGGFPATAAVCDLIIASQHTQKATGEPNRYLIV